MQEIIYTSAPKGLRENSSGYCTVQSSRGIPKPTCELLESLSGYRHLSQGSSDSPVNYCHLLLRVSGRQEHALSRVSDYDLDHTGRSNLLAHHMVLEQSDLIAAGPAGLLRQPRWMVTRWDGRVGLIDKTRAPQPDERRVGKCMAWEGRTGDAGWAGVLAEAFLANPDRRVFVVYEPGTNLLPLFDEAIRLLPVARRWQVTFSTYGVALPPNVASNVLWSGVIAGTKEAQTSQKHVTALRVDLTKPLPTATGGHLVEQARTGKAAEPQRKQRAAPKKITSNSDAYSLQAPLVEESTPTAKRSRGVTTSAPPIPEARSVDPLKIAAIVGVVCLLLGAAVIFVISRGGAADNSAESVVEKASDAKGDQGKQDRLALESGEKPVADQELAPSSVAVTTPPNPIDNMIPEGGNIDKTTVEAKPPGTKPGESATAPDQPEIPVVAKPTGPRISYPKRKWSIGDVDQETRIPVPLERANSIGAIDWDNVRLLIPQGEWVNVWSEKYSVEYEKVPRESENKFDLTLRVVEKDPDLPSESFSIILKVRSNRLKNVVAVSRHRAISEPTAETVKSSPEAMVVRAGAIQLTGENNADAILAFRMPVKMDPLKLKVHSDSSSNPSRVSSEGELPQYLPEIKFGKSLPQIRRLVARGELRLAKPPSFTFESDGVENLFECAECSVFQTIEFDSANGKFAANISDEWLSNRTEIDERIRSLRNQILQRIKTRPKSSPLWGLLDAGLKRMNRKLAKFPRGVLFLEPTDDPVLVSDKKFEDALMLIDRALGDPRNDDDIAKRAKLKKDYTDYYKNRQQLIALDDSIAALRISSGVVEYKLIDPDPDDRGEEILHYAIIRETANKVGAKTDTNAN